jgi:hypothetical protein
LDQYRACVRREIRSGASRSSHIRGRIGYAATARGRLRASATGRRIRSGLAGQ